ncbi:MAG: DUF885 domain-containing protein [Actinomycetales bacterium]|nr:DUF885 domain-containing protein [Actinomycetales bacterium]
MSAPANHPRRTTPVDEVAERHLDATLDLDPISATFLGLHGNDARLSDFSPAGLDARAALCRRTLSELDGLDAADPVDTITIAALRERLGAELALHEVGCYEASLNNISSPLQIVREVFDVAPSATAEDWEANLGRLLAVGEALAGARESLRHAVSRGHRIPARQVVVAAEQAAEFGAPDGFFVGFAGGAPASAGVVAGGRLAGALHAAAESAAAAYTGFADWLREELLPQAAPEDAVGRDRYPLYSRAFLGTGVDLDEAYAWGLSEVAEIEAEMARTARRIVPGDVPVSAPTAEAIDAAIAALDADPARTVVGAEAFRDWMQRLSDTAIADLADTHFTIPEPLRTLTCRIAPSTSGAIYYTAPTDDLSRPGQMWWSVPRGMTGFSTWRETSTIFHEGVPGHHLQIAGTIHRRDELNRWRRLSCWVSGHGEGWALYAERLMAELGFLDDPGDRMGLLDSQALRASRVVVDIGVHCRLTAPAEVGGGTWDADKAWRFLTAHTRMHEATRAFELDRYLGWPGQAPAYSLGERTWLDLRETLRRREGPAFDLRSFHTRALAVGSVGLDVLRSALLGTAPQRPEPVPATDGPR